MIFTALQDSKIWTHPGLVETAGVLVLACVIWVVICIFLRIMRRANVKVVYTILYAIAIGYWLLSQYSRIGMEWSSFPVKCGLLVILLAFANLNLINTPRHCSPFTRLQTLMANVFPIAGSLMIIGGDSPLELLIGIELISWGQYCGAATITDRDRRRSAFELIPRFMSLMFIIVGITLGDLNHVQTDSLFILPFGYLLFCVGVGWKFWLIPVRELLPDEIAVRTPQVYNNALWGIFATLFLLLKTVQNMPSDVARRLHVPCIVISIALIIFGGTLLRQSWKWRRFVAGFFTVFYGQTIWALSLRLWELASPDRNLTGFNDWPGAQVIMQLVVVTWTLGLTGITFCLHNLQTEEGVPDDVNGLAGAAADRPLTSSLLAVSILTLGGLPLTPGFWSSLFLLVTSVSSQIQSSLTGLYRPHAGFLLLSSLSVLVMAIGAFVSVRMVSVICFGFPRRRHIGSGSLIPTIVIFICGLVTLALGLIPNLTLQIVQKS